MPFPILLILGLFPSSIWLFVYLKEDSHPEPKSQVLRIFFYGMIIALPVAFIEIAISKILEKTSLSPVLSNMIYCFFGVAFVEEFAKYLVVKKKILNHPDFDEPIDAMLYMIIAALGFVALENILLLFSPGGRIWLDALSLLIIRFVSATLLHALCSAIVGFFLAWSLLETKNRLVFISLGLGIATFLHGLYNFSIIVIEERLKFILPLFILVSVAIFVSLGIQRLKKILSICKIISKT